MLRFLSIKSLRDRKFISFLCILSIALSLALFLIVEKLRKGVEQGFTNSISQANLIVGARSNPLQLLLYSIFHLGTPTNNITMDSFEQIKAHPLVDWTIPISLGDSYKGHRVVATDDNFIKFFRYLGDKKIEIEGDWFEGIFDVVLGSQVAEKLNHKIGDSLILSHGISEGTGLDHDETPFKVTGVLRPTGTPIDKSVYISLYGMEAIHIGWGDSSEKSLSPSDIKKEDINISQITSFILKSKNRIALLRLQRWISTYKAEPLTAIIPAVALTELWGLLDQVEKAFMGISSFVVLIGFLSILIILYMSLNGRKREILILRSIGLSSKQITFLLLFEAFILSTLGVFLGFIMQYGILISLSPILDTYYGIYLPLSPPSLQELYGMLVFITLGTLFGVIPAIRAYKTSLNSKV